ncbi:DNA-binding MarR family transcriptional regulator [Bradyrhizobium sp. S3.3.6]|uniref:hypothetical protein n=1 Tax=Bradyrhizobium sp. S3.3.6 TaxID=3156429 RepID=UPI0033940E60
MGWLLDLLEEVSLPGALRERVKLAEDKYTEHITELTQRVAILEKENAGLRDQLPQPSGLVADTSRVLVTLFRASNIDDRDVAVLTRKLQMEKSVLQYHLDELDKAGLATCAGGNYVSGALYWALTPAGRKKVVEEKLI